MLGLVLAKEASQSRHGCATNLYRLNRAVMTFAKSWNEVFGHPLPKGMQRAKARRELEIP